MLRSIAIASLFVCASVSSAHADFDWPMSVKTIDQGYPQKGSPCRRVGDTSATSQYFDKASILVGCPGARSSIFVTKFVAAQSGRVVGDVDGVTLVAIPLRKTPMAGAQANRLRCTLAPGKPVEQCAYDVTRKGGGISVVTIARPDGTSRAIYFANGRVTGADVKKPDNGTRPRVAGTREVDRFIVTIGSEQYDVPLRAVVVE